VTFKFDLLKPFVLESFTQENGHRVYVTPDGTFESVTTVIGKIPKPELDDWKKQIGNAKAKAITHQAGHRGKVLHSMIEGYLEGKDWRKGQMPINVETFKKYTSLIDSSVGLIKGIELPLWSKHLRTAGTTDLVCEWNGALSVVDIKTSRKKKELKHLRGYFMQITAYAIMLYERYGIKVPQMVILMAIDHEPEAQAFIIPFELYFNETVEFFRGATISN
jgi:ATP-dependent exoDNAse (exonuclease V) beta subunit